MQIFSARMDPWNLKNQFLTEIKKRGGFVNCHAHLDKALYITRDKLAQSMVSMEKKWTMSDEIKQVSTTLDIQNRIRKSLDLLIMHGVSQTATFIDAYSMVGMRTIQAIHAVKPEYEHRIKIHTITQPLGGLLDPKERHVYEQVTAQTSIAGGLPSKDRPYDNRSFDYLFAIAKNLHKPIHIHVDQENNPNERDTEKAIYYTKKYGYEGRVVLIHAISLSAQPKKYREIIHKKLVDAGIAVIVCPSAGLSMRQLDQQTSPIHNSIANVPEMLNAGVLVGLGVDNIADFYTPFVDGDMWVEIRMLMETCRFYDFNALVDICTKNGKEILEIT